MHRPQPCKVSMTGSSARIPFVKARGEAIRDMRAVYLWQLEIPSRTPIESSSVAIAGDFVGRCDLVNLGVVSGTNGQMLHGKDALP